MNPRYDLDLMVECPVTTCHAGVGEPCALPNQIVHFGRRVLAICKEKNIILHPKMLDHIRVVEGGDT